MNCYDDRLRELLEQVNRKEQLEAKLRSMYDMRSALTKKVKELDEICQKEQDDVDRLENGSLTGFFYSLIGRKVEKLDKEREEAYAAVLKYDSTKNELSALEDDIRKCEKELQPVVNSREQYKTLLAEKREILKNSGSLKGGEIILLEERAANFERQKKEISEAVVAGKKARNTVDSVLKELGDAENWGTYDVVGGGLIADMVKHDHLDKAQGFVMLLQVQLDKFRNELADVNIETEVKVNFDSFTKFADYFFDGLFADWTILDRIRKSKSGVEQTRENINHALNRLERMKAETEAQQVQIRKEIEKTVLEAEL